MLAQLYYAYKSREITGIEIIHIYRIESIYFWESNPQPQNRKQDHYGLHQWASRIIDWLINLIVDYWRRWAPFADLFFIR